MKLYELAGQYQELIPLAENADDEADLQAFYDTLDGLEGEIKEKVGNCAAVVKTLDAQASAIKAEEDRLAKRRQAIQNSRDRLKLYMQSGMEAAQLSKIKGELFTVSIADNPPSVVIDSEEMIPSDCKEVKITIARSRIAEKLKSGEPVAGAHLERTRSLRIR